jgi:hypothetical protein
MTILAQSRIIQRNNVLQSGLPEFDTEVFFGTTWSETHSALCLEGKSAVGPGVNTGDWKYKSPLIRNVDATWSFTALPLYPKKR